MLSSAGSSGVQHGQLGRALRAGHANPSYPLIVEWGRHGLKKCRTCQSTGCLKHYAGSGIAVMMMPASIRIRRMCAVRIIISVMILNR